MKLFTKAINDKLFQQYHLGNNLEEQVVVAKIFNPYGRGVWYLLNSDPNDPDYIWAIVDLFAVETGSVSRSELESIKVPPFGLPLERDLYFNPVNAAELLKNVQQGKRYAKGGAIDGETVVLKDNGTWEKLSETEKAAIAATKPYTTGDWRTDAEMNPQYAKGGKLNYMQKFSMKGKNWKYTCDGETISGTADIKGGGALRVILHNPTPARERIYLKNRKDITDSIDAYMEGVAIFARGGDVNDAGSIMVFPLTEDEKLDLFILKEKAFKFNSRPDLKKNAQDEYLKKISTYNFDGKTFYSLGYDTMGRGRPFSLEDAIKNAKIVKSLAFKKDNFEVIVRETAGSWADEDFTKKSYLVMTNPMMPKEALREFRGMFKYAKGGTTSNEIEFRKLAKSPNFDIIVEEGRFEIELDQFGNPKHLIDWTTGNRLNFGSNPVAKKYGDEIREYARKNKENFKGYWDEKLKDKA